MARIVVAVVIIGGCASPRPTAPPTSPPTAVAPATARPEAAVAPSGRDAPRGATSAIPALPPGCRHAQELRCSGMAPREGEPDEHTVVVCDECSANGDCTAVAEGRCIDVGGERCAGPSRRVCRYGPKCDPRKRRDCPDRVPPPFPPSRAGGGP